LLRTQVKREQNPGLLAISLNRLLPEFSGRGDFVTAFLAILDARSGIVQYTNCGHNPALLIRTDETTDKLVPSGPALGIFKDGIYETSSLTLQPGDFLILYTDGVIEMENAEGEFFGEPRLEEVICENNRLSVGDIQEAIVQATRSFTGQELYRDDFTLVILKRVRD
jgi:phosphoserine phosphatase RsbU/P